MTQDSQATLRSLAGERPARLDILLVGSESESEENTVFLLRSLGHQVHVVSRNAVGEERLAPDVLLLDLPSRPVDSWELPARVRDRVWSKRPFFIALAGDPERQTDPGTCGVDLVVKKPICPDYLGRLLERFSEIILPRPGRDMPTASVSSEPPCP